MKVRLTTRIKVWLEDAVTPRRLTTFLLKLFGLYHIGMRNAVDIKIVEHAVAFPNLPPAFDGYRLMMISDLHIDNTIDILGGILRATYQQEADALVLVGDYRYLPHGDHAPAIEKMELLLQEIKTPDGIYGVRGNHDSMEIAHAMQGAGARMLYNEAVELRRNEERIFLIGIDDPHYYHTDDIARATRNVPPDAFSIALVHTPERYKRAAVHHIDFYLCGHTHGGQIAHRKFGPIITNALAPRRMARGFWTYGSMRGYTSYGAGVSAVPVRLNAPPEVVIFTLKRGQEAA